MKYEVIRLCFMIQSERVRYNEPERIPVSLITVGNQIKTIVEHHVYISGY